MTSYVNPTGTFAATNGDDIFLFDQAPSSFVAVDGLAGYDSLTIDGSTAQSNISFSATYLTDDGLFYGSARFRPYDFGVTTYNFEAATYIGSASNDTFDLTIRSHSGDIAANFNGGGGNDTLNFDYSTRNGAVGFIANGASIESTFGTFSNFEIFHIVAGSGANIIHAADGDDEIQTGSGSADIIAGGGNDRVYTKALTGTVDGGAGYDSFSGQFGDGTNAITMTIGDTLTLNTGLVASNFESFSVGAAAGDDHIVVNRQGSIVVYGDAGYDTFTYFVPTDAAQNFTVNNTTYGWLFGGVGSVSFQEVERAELHGGGGNDTFNLNGNAMASAILLDGGAGTDSLSANFSLFDSSRFAVALDGTVDSTRGQFSNFENYTLIGGSGTDTFTTGSGNDTLDGNGGDDVLAGGLGDDIYTVRTTGTQVIEAENAGTDLAYAYVSWTLPTNVENLTLLAFGGIDGTGNALANVINGTEEVNVLHGMGGDDTLDGRGGNDTLYGDAGDDVLIGGAGINSLDGGDGIDTAKYNGLRGTYLVSALGNGDVRVTSGGFTDTLHAVETLQFSDVTISVSDLPIVLGTSGPDDLSATTDGASLLAFDGNDTLRVGAFHYVTLNGGNGDDDYYVNSAPFEIIEAANGGVDTIHFAASTSGYFQLPDEVENLVFSSTGRGWLTGNALGNRIVGDSNADSLTGLGGNDILEGKAGDDLLSGGDGSDIAVINATRAASTITLLDSGDVRVSSTDGVDTLSGIETIRFTDQDFAVASLTISGTNGNDTLTGTGDADTMSGLGGNDTLYGLGGDDKLDGGSGDDLLDGGDGFDVAVAAMSRSQAILSLGTDRDIRLSMSNFGNPLVTLVAGTDTLRNIEAIRFTDGQVAVADLVQIGTAGADTVTANAIGQLVFGLDGNDVLATASFGRIALDGGSGNDVLIAGTYSDVLTGGAGSDIFEGTMTALSGDTITDFGPGDKIHMVDASISTFSAVQYGQTFSYSGGILTLGSFPLFGERQRLVISADAAGGVDISLATRTVANDFNGDGRSDILWRSDAGQLSDWLGKTNGGFIGNDANAFTSVATNWHVVGTGDFNGDGRSDILWRSDAGQMSDWLGQANGGFVGNDANAFTSVPTNWHIVGTDDFNGDGRSDILWRSDSGQLSNWLGQANGGFVGNDANAFTSVPTNWKIAGTGDFNGDGRADILWRSDAGQLSDWLGQANGGFVGNDANAFTSVPTSWKIIGTGDFNGDGRTDILWRNDNGQMSDWLSQANGGFVSNDVNAFTSVPTSWKVAETGDYNGDGRDDILWRNDNGQLSNWLGQANGGFVGNDANAFTSVSTNWQPQPVHDLIV